MIEHLLLTNFNIRISGFGSGDPLEPARLNRRIQLFEAVAAPSVRAQSSQAFTWIIQIDPDLPPAIRTRIEAATESVRSVQIIEHPPNTPADTLTFCKPYLTGPGQEAVVTVLDDDDALHRDLLSGLQTQLEDIQSAGSLPPLFFMSCETALQWDFFATKDAPLGKLKPWARRDVLGHPYPTNAGFSIAFHKDLMDLALFKCHHNLVFAACRGDERRLVRHPHRLYRLGAFRNVLWKISQMGHLGWDGRLDRERHFAFYKIAAPQAVILNHETNLIERRRYDALDLAAPLLGPESLPGIAVDWDLVRRYLHAPE